MNKVCSSLSEASTEDSEVFTVRSRTDRRLKALPSLSIDSSLKHPISLKSSRSETNSDNNTPNFESTAQKADKEITNNTMNFFMPSETPKQNPLRLERSFRIVNRDPKTGKMVSTSVHNEKKLANQSLPFSTESIPLQKSWSEQETKYTLSEEKGFSLGITKKDSFWRTPSSLLCYNPILYPFESNRTNKPSKNGNETPSTKESSQTELITDPNHATSSEMKTDQDRALQTNLLQQIAPQNLLTRHASFSHLARTTEEKTSMKQLFKNQSLQQRSHPWRNLIFSPKVNKRVFNEHLERLQKGLVYATKCLRDPSELFLKRKMLTLPHLDPPQKAKTLILDLDETLIRHCRLSENPDRVAYAKKEDETSIIPFKIRPFALEFLKTISNYYEIVLFTASKKCYVEAILNQLDPKRELIKHVLHRSHCLQTKSGYSIKDLRVIRNRELKDMLIVDDTVYSFGYQLSNGIPILGWYGETNDAELKYLINYLFEAKDADDVRKFNEQRLRLKELAEDAVLKILSKN